MEGKGDGIAPSPFSPFRLRVGIVTRPDDDERDEVPLAEVIQARQALGPVAHERVIAAERVGGHDAGAGGAHVEASKQAERVHGAVRYAEMNEPENPYNADGPPDERDCNEAYNQGRADERERLATWLRQRAAQLAITAGPHDNSWAAVDALRMAARVLEALPIDVA